MLHQARIGTPKTNVAGWDVIVRREVRPLIDALKGRSSGYQAAYTQLSSDPCAVFPKNDGGNRPFAYRLSGPLGTKVCGVHLNYGYRLAFTMRPAADSAYEGVIEILYVGKRDTRDRAKDVWTIVHDLFGEQNPPDGHLRPPCCDEQMPVIEDDELMALMKRLRRLIRQA